VAAQETAATAAALTIDELARQTGMTVRNIRAHQSRGLLPSPEVRGRTGYYGDEHVARIELIKEMQADGFNLELIGRMLSSAGGSSAAVLRFTRSLREPFVEEEPEIIDVAELAQQWESSDVGVLEKAQKLGLLRPIGEGRFELVSPRLARAGVELLGLGISIDQMLEIVARLRRSADAVAKTFVDVFNDAVWQPFDAEGRPEERWPEVADAIERLRPLAAESLLAVFQLAMDEASERELEQELGRDSRRRR
jgi:DNA-binding transcriptional MerR regulator